MLFLAYVMLCSTCSRHRGCRGHDRMVVMVIAAGWEVIQKRPAHYMAAFLMMEGLIIGVFSSLDAILFYAFWEASHSNVTDCGYLGGR